MLTGKKSRDRKKKKVPVLSRGKRARKKILVFRSGRNGWTTNLFTTKQKTWRKRVALTKCGNQKKPQKKVCKEKGQGGERRTWVVSSRKAGSGEEREKGNHMNGCKPG